MHPDGSRRGEPSGLARIALAGEWAVASAPPGGVMPEAGGDWLPMAAAQTAAAAWRAAGRWSVQQASPSWDAQDWWFRCRFDHPALPGEAWRLGLDGLATLADVWLNGDHLLGSRNMFRAHVLDVGPLLRASGNELLIRCGALDADLARRRPRPRWRAPMIEQAQLRWLRTTLLGRTPGWSPAAAPVGPWRPVWLAPADKPTLQDLQLHTDWLGDRGRLCLQVQGPAGMSEADLLVDGPGQSWSLPVTLQPNGAWQLDTELPVQPWWPHTHGEPVLYTARLRGRLAGEWHTWALGAIGFRHLTLDTTDGGFALRINGEPIFCRGACWTPLDPVALQASPEALAQAVSQVRAAGMNMLRLAGPMVYEQDAFYDACDAQGVLVWQEFMFANMDYPADDPEFLAEVEAEVRQQLQRWQARPSLAVLCGNSEQEQQAAMWGAPREAWASPLFHSHLPRWCAQAAPGVPYWPSSAHGGAFPFQPNEGTTSYYGVGAYLRPLDDAITSGLRFATECLAFAQVPPLSTLMRLPDGPVQRVHAPAWKAGVPRDLGAGWDFDDVRDHYFEVLTSERPERLRAVDPQRYLALSRWVSGYVMQSAFAQWRAAGSVCRGALVWFLRDLRPGAGWGLLDDAGVPKAAWHLLARQLQPLMLGFTDHSQRGPVLHLINERPQAVSATLRWSAWQQGRTRVAGHEQAVTLPPRSVQARPLLADLDGFMDLGWRYRFGPPVCDLWTAELVDGDGQVLARATHLPLGLSLHRHADIGLQASLRRDDQGRPWLDLRCAAAALGLHIEAPGFLPADDYLDLPPGGQASVLLQPDPTMAPPRTLRASVTALNTEQVCSLVDLGARA